MNIAYSFKSAYAKRYLWRKYFKLRSRFEPKRIEKFQNMYSGGTIFCIGTGPSLKNEQHLDLLNNQIVIFTNASYKLMGRINPAASFWIVQDHHRLIELKDVSRSPFTASFKAFHDIAHTDLNSIIEDDILLLPEIGFRHLNGDFYPKAIETLDHFSDELHKNISLAGSSVIFSAIQLASYMGAKKIILLGVDMSYRKSVKESYFDGEQEKERFTWQLDYEKYSKKAFMRYNDLLKSKGITFINSTEGTKEDVTIKLPLIEAIK